MKGNQSEMEENQQKLNKKYDFNQVSVDKSTIITKGYKDSTFSFPTCASVHPTTGILYVTDKNRDLIQLFDSNLTPIRIIEHPLLIKPWGLRFDSKGNILVSTNTNVSHLLIFNTNDELIRKIVAFQREFYDFDLIDDNHLIVATKSSREVVQVTFDELNDQQIVVDVDFDPSSCGISRNSIGNFAIVTKNGFSMFDENWKHMFAYESDQSIGSFSHVEFDQFDRIALSENSRGQIELFDCDANLISTLEGKQNTDLAFVNPRCIRFDDFGHLIVCSNHKVHILHLI